MVGETFLDVLVWWVQLEGGVEWFQWVQEFELWKEVWAFFKICVEKCWRLLR